MTTITIWLLITVGYRNDAPTVLERFPTMQECERVRDLLPTKYSDNRAAARCVQATVVR